MDNPLDSLKTTLQSDQFKKIMPYLLAGGAGATAGAFMSGGRRGRGKRRESRMSYLGRVLRNALATGGIAAGGTALARYGADKLSSKEVTKGMQAPGMDNPADQTLRSTLFSPVTALGAGTAGLWATHKLPGIGANTASTTKNREALAAALKLDDGNLGALTPSALKAKMHAAMQTAPNSFVGGIKETANRAGLTVGNKIHSMKSMKGLDLKGALGGVVDDFKQTPDLTQAIKNIPRSVSTELGLLGRSGAGRNITHNKNQAMKMLKQLASKATRSGPLATLGQSGGRRSLRTGVGLAAAAIPALIGAFATDKKQEQ